MTTPWQLQQDLTRVNNAELAGSQRQAAQLRELELDADHGRLRRGLRAAWSAVLRRRPRLARVGPAPTAIAEPSTAVSPF